MTAYPAPGTRVLVRGQNPVRTIAILLAIGSHDVNLPRDTSALFNLHLAALDHRLIADRPSEDKN